MKQTKKYSTVLNMIALPLFVLLFTFFMYTFLHEAGHALAGWLFGQSLTEFDVSFWDFSAHVGLTGGELTQIHLAIRSISGALLPLCLWVIFISLFPRKSNFTIETLKLSSSMVVVNTLLTWIFIPILFMFGKAPSDDVTNFLGYSQMSPMLLSFTAIVLYIGGWILFLSRTDGLRNTFLMFRTTDFKNLNGGARTTLPVMTAILIVCAILVFTVNNFAANHPLNRLSPPQDFTFAAQIDLSNRPNIAETIVRFTVEEPAQIGVFVVVRDINTTLFDLSVLGSDGYSSTVLHGEGYRASEDGGLWEKNLLPGTYRLVLTSHRSPGIVSVYLKGR